MARVRQSAAMAPNRASESGRDAGNCFAPVANANTTSPSNGANTGRTARATPALAICATRFASAGAKSASKAMQAIVVFVRGCGENFAPLQSSASTATFASGRKPPNSPLTSNGHAQNAREPGIVVEPQQFTQA